MTEEMLDWDRQMGLHSGFPACCVAEYVRDASLGLDHQKAVNASKAGRLKNAGKRAEYVPCNACVAAIEEGSARPVQLDHRCKDSKKAECVELLAEFERLTGRTIALQAAAVKKELPARSKAKELP